MAENIVSVENISKRYAEKELFESSTFGIHKGEKIGILGINGSGKSTLLKILAKEESADSGKISYQNNDFDSYLSSSVLASHRWHKPMAFNHAKIIKCAIRL